MVFQPKLRMTVEDFDQWVEQLGQFDKLHEYIGGEIVEVPSNAKASQYSSRFIMRIGLFVEANDFGHVTGEAGGCMIYGERYTPYVAFVSKSRTVELSG